MATILSMRTDWNVLRDEVVVERRVEKSLARAPWSLERIIFLISVVVKRTCRKNNCLSVSNASMIS